jgi:hypothetical protein
MIVLFTDFGLQGPYTISAGERGRIVSAVASNAGLARLVEMQYVTKQPQSERKTLYVY